MGSAYQIQDQGGLYFLTFQVVGWADIFSRPTYRDMVIDSFKLVTHLFFLLRGGLGDLGDGDLFV